MRSTYTMSQVKVRRTWEDEWKTKNTIQLTLQQTREKNYEDNIYKVCAQKNGKAEKLFTET
jgi:hypothetical protein